MRSFICAAFILVAIATPAQAATRFTCTPDLLVDFLVEGDSGLIRWTITNTLVGAIAIDTITAFGPEWISQDFNDNGTTHTVLNGDALIGVILNPGQTAQFDTAFTTGPREYDGHFGIWEIWVDVEAHDLLSPFIIRHAEVPSVQLIINDPAPAPSSLATLGLLAAASATRRRRG